MRMKWVAPMTIGVFFLGASGVLAACGTNSTASSTTVAQLGATNYQTLPPTQSTAPVSTIGDVAPGQVSSKEQSYTVAQGDGINGIAAMFQISVVAIATANGWPNGGVGHHLFPGDVLKIPAGAIVPLPTTTTQATAPPSTPACIKTTHTIVPGETPQIVAKKYGTTIQKLGLANMKTKGYRGFVVGVKINIPC